MSEHETAEAINEQAMRWVAVLDREGRTPGLVAELDAWLAGDTRRQGAFLRAEAAWSALDRARLLPEASAAPPSRRRLLVGGGALAASVVAGAGGWLAYRAARTVRIETAKGEIRRVPLSDGSLAIVNTGSDVKVELAADLRAVRLGEGEAWFEVARDKARPFVVAAGDVRVRALGTSRMIPPRNSAAASRVPGAMSGLCSTKSGAT